MQQSKARKEASTIENMNLTNSDNLVPIISISQLERELVQRTQQFFTPSKESSQEIEKIRCLIECSVCGKLPLVIRQCVVCEAVICNQCRLEAISEGDDR